jgi:hypothetical protein
MIAPLFCRTAAIAAVLGLVALCPTFAGGANRPQVTVAPADLGACPDLEPPAGAELTFHAYAVGVQIYRWDGEAWAFVAPEADLYADAGGNGHVGIHYAGPTWESTSGSAVLGRVAHRCTPDPDAIPWLSLDAVSSHGPGVFDGVTFIQRVNTVGGKAPATPGTVVGGVTRVPYTAEYYFYR